MIEIGAYQTLTIGNRQPQGFYLKDEEGEEVLLPNAYITETMQIGDEIEVFVYCDSNDENVATTEKPFLTVGQFACLEVMDVNKMGAFCDWGLKKELLIPFSNQKGKLRTGQKVIIYLYLDEASDLLVGSTKINRYLQMEADDELHKGQEVDLIVYAKTDLGYKVIVNQKYGGLVYKSEVPRYLEHGQEIKGYIKPLRDDGKIDVSIAPLGHRNIEPGAERILEILAENDGFLPYTDKSDPRDIRYEFDMSKKTFKKSLGHLYKLKLVELKPTGIFQVKA